MAAVERVLIVGAGIGGLAMAIALRERGIAVDIVELESRVLGLGITLTGTTLRALDVVGLATAAAQQGFGFDFFLVSDGAGKLQAKNPLPPARAGLPAAVGIKRPLFANIMTEAAEAGGASIRYGLTVEAIEQDDAAVSVRFTDNTTEHYDLVVGADGVFSGVRKRVFGEAYEPTYVGQGVYRFMTERHPSIDQLQVFVGPKLKAGFIPLSDDSMYLFTTMSYPPHTRIDESKTSHHSQGSLEGFHGSNRR